MIIRSSKDIPDEIKNIVELYYVRSPEIAVSQAHELIQTNPDMSDLVGCVLKLMGHAPESVFMFYDELITLYSNSGAREDIPLSVDDLMGDGSMIEDLGPLDIPLLDALSLDMESDDDKESSSQIDSAFSSILTGIQSAAIPSQASKEAGVSGLNRSVPSAQSHALSNLSSGSERVGQRGDATHVKTLSPEDKIQAVPGERPQHTTVRDGEFKLDAELNDFDFDAGPANGFDKRGGFDLHASHDVHAKDTAATLKSVPGDLFAGFANSMRNPEASPVIDANNALTPVPSASLSDIMRSSRRAQALGDSSSAGLASSLSASGLSSSFLKKLSSEDKNNETRPNVGALNPYLSESGRPINLNGVLDNSRPTLHNMQPVQQQTTIEKARPTMAVLTPVAPVAAGTASPESLEPLSRIPRLKCSMAEISQRTDVNPRAGFILSLIDGFTSIADILDISAWPEPETAFILLELQQQGIVAFT